MYTQLDLRLAYHSDTGQYPENGCVESLRGDLEFEPPFDDEEDSAEEDEYEEKDYFEIDEEDDAELDSTKTAANRKINSLNQEIAKLKQDQRDEIALTKTNIQLSANEWTSDMQEYIKYLEEKIITLENK